MSRFVGLLFALFAAPVSASEISGSARVIDADTVEVASVRIRLQGIDAPELDQVCLDAAGRRWSCGSQAANALRAGLEGSRITCDDRGRDRYGRWLGLCRTDHLGDVGAWLVERGFSRAYRRYSSDYIAAEEAARRNNVGIWAGSSLAPWEHRARRRIKPASSSLRGCRIKGNISSNGRIYHMPGGRWYDVTRIHLDRGERWFCSETYAREAGWRPAEK